MAEIEERREVIIEWKYIPKIIVIGLVVSCISIIYSVDYLFQNQRYVDLIITSILFVTLIFLIRRFKKIGDIKDK